MWKLMKFLLWIACAMSFGVLLSTVKMAGQTPVQRAQRMWVKYGVDGKVEEHVSDLKDSVQGALDRKSVV